MMRTHLLTGLGLCVGSGLALASTNNEQPVLEAVGSEPTVTLPIVRTSNTGAATPGLARLVSDDGENSLAIGARLDFDAIWDSDDGAADQDRLGFRRTRLVVEGHSLGVIGYRAVVDFNGPNQALEIGGTRQTEFADLYLTLNDFLGAEIRAGQFFEPFGMEANTYSENISFMERSESTSLITPGRGIGVMLSDTSDDGTSTWALGLFSAQGDGGNLDKGSIQASGLGGAVNGTGSYDIEGNFAITGRGTIAPLFDHGGTEVVHLGASFTARDAAAANLTAPGPGGFESDLRIGAEAAVQFGRVMLQAEYLTAGLDGDGPTGPNLDLYGMYAQFSYMFTGEHRTYANGRFGPVEPNSPWRGFGGDGTGAFELAVRISSSKADTPGAIVDTDVLEAGVNWYMNASNRLMLGVQTRNDDDPANDEKEALTFRWQLSV